LGAGCLSDDSPLQESEVTSPVLSTVGVERIIPLHYYVLNCSVPTTDATIYEGVKIANRTWQSAGIQYSVNKIDRISAPKLTTINTIKWDYSYVYDQLKLIDPTLTPNTFAGIGASNDDWLGRIADRLDHREIPVIVPCTELAAQVNGHASFPPGHLMHLPPHVVGTDTLSHELGHYMGLGHTFEVQADVEYDMLFGVDGASSVFFKSAAEVAAFRATGKPIERKDGYRTDDRTKANCTFIDTTSCEMQCFFNGRTYRTSTSPDIMRGMQSAVANAPHAFSTNVMSYFECKGAAGVELKELVPSQMQLVRDTLRKTFGDRNLLGRGSVRLGPKRSSTLDFDGDKKRDLAYFRPETSECVYRRSRDGVEVRQKISGGDPAQGDIPVPADYDGDGYTDCAIFRPGKVGVSAEWRYVASGAWGITRVEKFGERGDIPVADVRMKTASGGGRFAIYRPLTGEVWWKDGSSARSLFFNGWDGDDIVFADYDGDGYTDPALWQPESSTTSSQARFKIAYSRSSYATARTFNFGLEGDVPVGPVNQDGTTELDFAVWRPSNGTWYYLLNPRADGSSGYREQVWGEPGDAPIPGWDIDHDGKDDEVISRIVNGSNLQLWIRRTSLPYFVVTTGVPSDVPFFIPDTNGDLMPELVLYRPTLAGTHQISNSSSGGYPTSGWIGTSMVHSDIEL
jgi:hypothetical protein